MDVLNRLDGILEHLDESYKTSTVGFPESSPSFPKNLVLQILNFTTQLLNNCSNVKYYNSVEVSVVFVVVCWWRRNCIFLVVRGACDVSYCASDNN